MIAIEGFAHKSATKLYNAIQKARETELKRFIYASGIPRIGRSASADIANACGSLEGFQEDIEKGLPITRNIEGIGEIMVQNILQYRHLLDHLRNYVTPKKQEKALKATVGEVYTFVITGTLSEARSYYENLLINAGHKVSGSVSKKTNYLLAGENVGATKLNKAQQLGVKIIGKSELTDLLSM